ncbi:MAG: hypothetical protein ACLFR8_11495 [Alkalispirochaeta sp.]
MNPNAPILLREKFALVHVPSRRKCLHWAQRCAEAIASGVPPESAGVTAARSVFPYEAKERPLPGTADVTTILTAIHGDG